MTILSTQLVRAIPPVQIATLEFGPRMSQALRPLSFPLVPSVHCPPQEQNFYAEKKDSGNSEAAEEQGHFFFLTLCPGVLAFEMRAADSLEYPSLRRASYCFGFWSDLYAFPGIVSSLRA